MAKNKVVPITRVNKFFSADDFSLEIDFGKEWLEGDINMTVILYRVNRDETITDSVYGETIKDGVRYHQPVEIHVLPTLNEPTLKSYNSNGSLSYREDGNLVFGVYSSSLEELEVDIRIGDYIGYAITESKMNYYTVEDDGRKNSDNAHTILGFKGAFRTITCTIADETDFRGI